MADHADGGRELGQELWIVRRQRHLHKAVEAHKHVRSQIKDHLPRDRINLDWDVGRDREVLLHLGRDQPAGIEQLAGIVVAKGPDFGDGHQAVVAGGGLQHARQQLIIFLAPFVECRVEHKQSMLVALPRQHVKPREVRQGHDAGGGQGQCLRRGGVGQRGILGAQSPQQPRGLSPGPGNCRQHQRLIQRHHGDLVPAEPQRIAHRIKHDEQGGISADDPGPPVAPQRGQQPDRAQQHRQQRLQDLSEERLGVLQRRQAEWEHGAQLHQEGPEGHELRHAIDFRLGQYRLRDWVAEVEQGEHQPWPNHCREQGALRPRQTRQQLLRLVALTPERLQSQRA